MFPEPPSPFGKEAFNLSFENAKSASAEEGVVYRLPDFKKNNTSDEIGPDQTTIV